MNIPLTEYEKGLQSFLGCTKEQLQNADGSSYSSAKAEYEAWLRITGLGMLPHYSQELGEEFTK